MAKEDKLDIRNAKRTASKMRKGELRVSASAVKQYNQTAKKALKAGKLDSAVKVTSSGFKQGNKSISAVKPSMPVKTGAKNKMKAQGAKTQSMGMQYSRGTRPKGK